jgi:soluble lytic murein transglycosylase-like protein
MNSHIDIDPAEYLASPGGWRSWLQGKRSLLSGRLGILGLSLSAVLFGISIARIEHQRSAQVAAEYLEAQETEAQRLAGELALERLTSYRLQAVHDYSTKHRIPAGLAASIYDVSLAEGLDPELAFRLVEAESAFRRLAVSSAGAVGYTQIKPSTAYWLDPPITPDQLFETETNLRLGFRYLGMLLEEHGQDTRLALLAYNRGPGRVGELIAMGRDPANGYASRILQAE